MNSFLSHVRQTLFICFWLGFLPFVSAQTNLLTVDFETDGAGYTATGAYGSGFTDLFNRTNASLTPTTNESGYYWGAEDLNSGTRRIDLDQIDITGLTSFTFAIDMLAHHYVDWDASDELLITYSVDGGAYQNLMWVQMIRYASNPSDGTNGPAGLDIAFDGDGDCGAATTLPSISTGTAHGCTVSSSDFATFTTGDVSLSSNTTLDIRIDANNLTSGDEGIYFDNIIVNGAAPASTATMDYYNLQWPAGGTIDVGSSFDVYAQAYEGGVTEAAGAGTGVECWIGYSDVNATQLTDFDGSGWTWVPASFYQQIGNNDEFSLDLGSSITAPGTYYYVSRWSLDGGPYTYGGTSSGSTGSGGGNAWDGSTNASGVLTVNDRTMDYYNLQSPSSGTIDIGSSFDVYAQAYEGGVTEATGAGTGVECWIGYSTIDATQLTDFEGSGWTWVAASFSSQVGSNDEFVAEIGTGLSATGTYYYVSRWKLGLGSYTYGGYNGGAWDGSSNTSGVLTVNDRAMDYANVQFPASGSIIIGDAFDVYAQGFESGVTEAAGAGADVECWIGYSTTDATTTADFATGWTWVAASFNSQVGSNDEFVADIGSGLTATGTYYYVSRWKLGSGSYTPMVDTTVEHGMDQRMFLVN